jgi:hypothetical protein
MPKEVLRLTEPRISTEPMNESKASSLLDRQGRIWSQEQGRKEIGVGMLDHELGLWMGFPKEPI